MDWVFKLPVPPTTNHLFATGADGRRHVSKKYAQWMRDAKKFLTAQRRPAEPITYRVSLDIQVPRIKNADVSNRIKAVEDMCVKGGILKDDSLVERVSAEWIDTGPDCVLRIRTIEDAARLSA